MAESEEHRFISTEFLGALERLATSKLYGYREADRGIFDFACGLERDWLRLLSGQTLWKHTDGVPKDLLYLLTEDQSAVVAYIARHTASNQRVIYELLERFGRSAVRTPARRIKVFWVPSDFDADSEDQREMLRRHLWQAVANDILLNILFGRLTSIDIRFFLNGASIQGLMLAILQSIAKEDFVNYPDLARRVDANPTTMRPRVADLLGCGFLWTYPGASEYHVSSKGRAFLDICYRIKSNNAIASSELLYILGLLGVSLLSSVSDRDDIDAMELSSADDVGQLLLSEISAVSDFGVAIDGPPYKVDDDELSNPGILMH